jgi:PAS domain S-box-containing protein
LAEAETQSRWLASRHFAQSVLDALPQHIAVLDQSGRIVATNAAWRQFGQENGLDEQHASGLGLDYLEICGRARGHAADGAREAAEGIRAVAEGRQGTFVLEYLCPSATRECWFTMRVTRFEAVGHVWLTVAHENTTRRMLAERSAREAAERLRLALAAADLGTWDNDLLGHRISCDARCRAIFGIASDQANLDEVIALIHPNDRAVAMQAFEAALTPDGPGTYDVETRIVRPDAAVRWVSAKGCVLFAETGTQRRPMRTIGVLADVTERRHAEEAQHFLLQEMNHRIRNLLATIGAVTTNTVRGSTSLAEFEQDFAGRLDALARTYTLLGAAEWRSTSLRALVEQALAPYLAPGASNGVLRGDEVQVCSRMALPLSLVLHELATNAIKYGALSVPEGHVEIDWCTEGTSAEPRLVLEWREHAGPAVSAPRRRGFGRHLIERSVAYELGGSTELQFTPTGVRFRLEAPLSRGMAEPRACPPSPTARRGRAPRDRL